MLRNHLKPSNEADPDVEMSRPITRKQVWDWIAIVRWALPGLVVAGLWVWNTSAVSASRETAEATERAALVAEQKELKASMAHFTETVNRAAIVMEKWITIVETHEKRLDKLEGR